jgi:hypothetical protein
VIEKPPTDAPPLPNLPTGAPLVRILAGALPSINEVLEKIYVSPNAASGIIKAERKRGRRLAVDWAKSEGRATDFKVVIDRRARSVRGDLLERLIEPVTFRPVFVAALIWRKRSIKDATRSDKVRDTYNASLKGLVDGFIDANLLTGDSELEIPSYLLHYVGLAPDHKTEILIYEL